MQAPPLIRGGRARLAGWRSWTRIALLLLAVLVRALALADTDPKEVYSRWSTATDAGVYDRFGWNLATRGILGVGERPSAFALPAYPVLLGAVYRTVGHSPGAVRWVQVVLGALTVALLGRLARALGGELAEAIAMVLSALDPFFVYFNREILTETLFIFAFAGMMLTATRVGTSGRRADGIAHGGFAALAIMTRPVGLFLEAGALLLARPWDRENRRPRLEGLLLGLLLVAGVWGGWMVRNRKVFGEVVPLDTHGGFALYAGQLFSRGLSADEVFRSVGYSHREIEEGTLPGGPRGELEADRRCATAARKMIREDRIAFIATWPRNVGELWLGMDFSDVAARGGGGRLMAIAGLAVYVPLLGLALGGIGVLIRERKWGLLSPLLVILVLTTTVHAMVLGGKRYRVATVDPVLLVLAATSASGSIRALRRRAERKGI